jgi:hypothetical protein
MIARDAVAALNTLGQVQFALRREQRDARDFPQVEAQAIALGERVHVTRIVVSRRISFSTRAPFRYVGCDGFVHCHGPARFFPGLPLAQYSTRHIHTQGAWAGRRARRSDTAFRRKSLASMFCGQLQQALVIPNGTTSTTSS